MKGRTQKNKERKNMQIGLKRRMGWKRDGQAREGKEIGNIGKDKNRGKEDGKREEVMRKK